MRGLGWLTRGRVGGEGLGHATGGFDFGFGRDDRV